MPRGISRLTALRACVGFALAAVALHAQGGPPAAGLFPWWEGQISSELNLSDSQRQQLESIQREFRGRLIDNRAEQTKAELELDDAMTADPFDMRKANDAANRASKARDELTRNFTQMSLRMRAVLTKQQWQTAQQRAMRGGGPGGMGVGMGGPRGGDRSGRGGGPERGPDRGPGGFRKGPGGPDGGPGRPQPQGPPPAN